MVKTETDLTKAIEDFVTLLKKGLAIEVVILFGSHAHGTAHEDSDIDLAIISPDFEGLPLARRQIMIADLSIRRPWDLSPIGYPSSEYHNPGPHSFLREIIRTGKIVDPHQT